MVRHLVRNVTKCHHSARLDRERQRLQHEVIEMTASVDQVQKEKHIAEKAAEKYEQQSRELGNKVDDLQKHVNDLAAQRQRLQVTFARQYLAMEL